MKQLIFTKNKYKAEFLCNRMSKKFKTMCWVVIDYNDFVVCTNSIFKDVYYEYVQNGDFTVNYRKEYHEKITKEKAFELAEEKGFKVIHFNKRYSVISPKAINNNKKLEKYVVNE